MNAFEMRAISLLVKIGLVAAPIWIFIFSENLHSYVNNINTHEGGTHLSGNLFFDGSFQNVLGGRIYFLET